MFDIGASELLLIVVVAIVVIGPKDLPLALRTAGRWIGKIRRISGHFRQGIETMIREAELEEMERKWREQNEAIMKAHPQVGDVSAAPAAPAPTAHTDPEPAPADHQPAQADHLPAVPQTESAAPEPAAAAPDSDQPKLI